jgi:hypothetical protein
VEDFETLILQFFFGDSVDVLQLLTLAFDIDVDSDLFSTEKFF